MTREINDRRVAIVRSIGWGAVLMGNWMWCQSWTLPHGMPQGWPRASADRLASRVASGLEPQPELLEEVDGGNLLRAARVIRNSSRAVTGVVVASDYLSGDLAERSRRMTTAYERYYSSVCSASRWLASTSFFLMVTLLILVSSTHMDALCPCQTHHASRSAAIGRGAESGKAATTSASSMKGPTSLDR